jgi:ubiquinone/menaquinone biosynthesis C-methylase UbiE
MKVDNQESVWNEIAVKWNEFRETPSPTVVEFLSQQGSSFYEGSKDKKWRVLDLGCGSGRNFSAMAKDIQLHAVDFSKEMLVHAKEKAEQLGLKVDIFQSNSDKIPFKDNYFDSIICVAVLHCVPSKEERANTIKEIYRTLKKGSSALISVWGKNSPRLKNKPKECFVSWTVKSEKDSRKGEQGIKQERYTYIYDLEELKKEILDAGFEIENIWEERNVNVIVKKL